MEWEAFTGFKKFIGGGGVESDYSVCPRPLLQFLQFLQFLQVLQFKVSLVTSVYIFDLGRVQQSLNLFIHDLVIIKSSS